MGEVGTAFLLSQLGYQGPALLVYFVAIVLALVYLGRARGAAVLTLAGAGVLILTAVGAAVANAALLDSREADGRSAAETGRLMGIVGIIGSCLRAVGLGLWVAAVFVGRRSARGRESSPGGGP